MQRLVIACVLVLAARLSAAEVTVLLEFDGARSDRSVVEMKREAKNIFKDSGVLFEWRLRDQVRDHETFADIVVIKFKGRCRMETFPALIDERGPLAQTYSSAGVVLPFSEVQCDPVRRSIGPAMMGQDYQRADTLLGRALGRVLAHEIYHILGQTKRHSPQGVARAALPGSQVISGKLRLTPGDLERFTLP